MFNTFITICKPLQKIVDIYFEKKIKKIIDKPLNRSYLVYIYEVQAKLNGRNQRKILSEMINEKEEESEQY